MSTEQTHLTITLTGRAPVRIVRVDWPETTRGRAAVDLPSYECTSWRLVARQHADGRAVVYGIAQAPNAGWPTHGAVVYGIAQAPNAGWPTHGAADWRGGELLDAGEDLVAAIQRVGAELVAHGGAPESIVRECIAALPAEEV